MDGTFKCVKRPFRQLFGIHAFVRCGEAVKQVPLVSILMSRYTKLDYDAVWRELIQKVLSGTGVLQEAILDFEMAAWISLRNNFPDINIHGCLFHYSQAVFRKVGTFHLIADYKRDGDVRELIKKLFAIPLLPARRMGRAFERIKTGAEEAGAGPNVMSLLNYVNQTWFNHPVWRPVDFCAYQRVVRTKNDQEGYHRRLNARCKAGEGTPLYKLLETVYNEARLVDLTCKLVSNQAMSRRKATLKKQAGLDQLWEDHLHNLGNGDDDAADEELLNKAWKYASF